jgi:hypothetical protein
VTPGARSASLDRATCAIAITRLQFRPATDAGGKAVTGQYPIAVRWIIPLGRRSQSQVIEISFGSNGSLQSCREIRNQQPIAYSAECGVISKQPPFSPGTLPVGTRTVRLETWIGYADAPDAPRDAFDAFTIVRRQTMRFHVAATGEVSGCEQEESSGTAPVAVSPCAPGFIRQASNPEGRPFDEVVVTTLGAKP